LQLPARIKEEEEVIDCVEGGWGKGRKGKQKQQTPTSAPHTHAAHPLSTYVCVGVCICMAFLACNSLSVCVRVYLWKFVGLGERERGKIGELLFIIVQVPKKSRTFNLGKIFYMVFIDLTFKFLNLKENKIKQLDLK